MAGASGVGGSKRHLPSWMFGSTKQETKPGVAHKKFHNPDEELTSRTHHAEGEKEPRNFITEKEKREKKRGKKKPNPEEPRDQVTASEISSLKYSRHGRRVGDSKTQRKRNVNDRSAITDDVEVQCPVDEDEDLTVEELINIAKEYVSADEEKKRLQKLQNSEHRSGSESSTAVLLERASGDLRIASDIGFGSSVVKRNDNCSILSSSGEPSLTHDPVKTGDPARDMLDLLLGPLLKIPESEKPSPVITNHFDIGYELRKQDDRETREEMVAVKKCSLKEKVSTFLD